MKDNLKDAFDTFITELQMKEKLHSADRKIRYYWELQQQRLKKLGLDMQIMR